MRYKWATPLEVKQAIIKFNNGRGALLCNKCQRILAEGFHHEDKIHLCENCARME